MIPQSLQFDLEEGARYSPLCSVVQRLGDATSPWNLTLSLCLLTHPVAQPPFCQ